MIAQKPLKVGKRWRYRFDVSAQLSGEPLTGFIIETEQEHAILIGIPVEDSPGIVGFFLEGVFPGRCKIHINYTTATRSDCATGTVIVQNC